MVQDLVTETRAILEPEAAEVAEGKDGPVTITVQKNAVGALLPKGTLKNL